MVPVFKLGIMRFKEKGFYHKIRKFWEGKEISSPSKMDGTILTAGQTVLVYFIIGASVSGVQTTCLDSLMFEIFSLETRPLYEEN